MEKRKKTVTFDLESNRIYLIPTRERLTLAQYERKRRKEKSSAQKPQGGTQIRSNEIKNKEEETVFIPNNGLFLDDNGF